MKYFEVITNYTTKAKLNKNTPVVICCDGGNFKHMKLVKDLDQDIIYQFNYEHKSFLEIHFLSYFHDRLTKKGTFIRANNKFFLEYEEPTIYL